MVRGSVVGVGLALGLSALSGCGDAVAGKGEMPGPGSVEAGLEAELAFAEPVGRAPGVLDSDLVREPASPADLSIPLDFDPMIDPPPLGQDGTEAAFDGEEDGGGREVVTDEFDDSGMTDDGILPPRGGEEPPLDLEEPASRP